MARPDERMMDGKFSEGLETLVKLARHRGFTVELSDAIRKDDGADKAIEALRDTFGMGDKNPFAQPVSAQIAALRRANSEEGWGIPDETIDRLIGTAPAWPEGRDSYRSFRIRFGEGDEGVAKTFEAHVARIKRVHGDAKFWRWELLLSGKHPYKGEDVERLRLLSGNVTHKPVVEWTTVRLNANRKRPSITAVRGPQSLADEGLVMTWLFPKRVEAIDYDKWCAWFCAGYELNVPEGDDESWQDAPCVGRHLGTGRVRLVAGWHGDDDSGYSVPAPRE